MKTLEATATPKDRVAVKKNTKYPFKNPPGTLAAIKEAMEWSAKSGLSKNWGK
jgi:hypothetical protein